MTSTKPNWLKARLRLSPEHRRVESLLEQHGLLRTVCREAACPNLGECYGSGTATFLILGSVCTRNCGFCNIGSGRPLPVNPKEPQELANAAMKMGLKHVVITSVTRDDLPDGGAGQFSSVISALRRTKGGPTIEVLIPDLLGNYTALNTILRAKPDILNHNLETVPRLYPSVRPRADYGRSLALLKAVKSYKGGILTKSGLMLGLGESDSEVVECLADLSQINCDIVTLGQYLPPTKSHFPLARFLTPDEFAQFERKALKLGLRKVFAGPLVRSSYRAQEALHGKPVAGTVVNRQ